jgi:E3 ubiquitin-protein ligase RGLG
MDINEFTTLPDVTKALRKAGLESSSMIIGFDFTGSNEWTGELSFGNKPLHTIDVTGVITNPYEEVARMVGETLSGFDDDNKIPAFGFGDSLTTDKRIFPLSASVYANGFDEVVRQYRHMASRVKLSGPTSFVPLVEHAIEIAQMTGQYQVLLIITDGAVTNVPLNAAAIVKASNFPISIICVGVGDGPWDTMEAFDSKLEARKFDNFQFVQYNKVKADALATKSPLGPKFALQALQELPKQYKEIQSLGFLGIVTRDSAPSAYVAFHMNAVYGVVPPPPITVGNVTIVSL